MDLENYYSYEAFVSCVYRFRLREGIEVRLRGSGLRDRSEGGSHLDFKREESSAGSEKGCSCSHRVIVRRSQERCSSAGNALSLKE